jgi:hypothetical protein
VYINEQAISPYSGKYFVALLLTIVINWFPVLFPSKSLDHTMSCGGPSAMNEINYGFVYIAHPRAVTNLSWRKTSKYMPK